ncbi:MAG TPA: amidase, partial [Xanthobacteraceae bacterium]|nr:amidase [Xanthobacteraceae bacterium]
MTQTSSGVEIGYMPATRMAEAIRRKELSPVEIVRAVLDRIERFDPALNAFVTVTADAALGQAREAEQAVMRGDPLGALHGVPVSLKDSMATAGVRTTLGSKMFSSFVPTEDAPLVERLRRAGGIAIGKTAMPEFAWKAVTDSPLQGITRSPWNLDYSPGGSSGGASAQIAGGMGPLAAGTDGGGSIRVPASFTGIYGIKPSFGRIPVYPSSAFDALSHPGPLTRTVADAALFLSVVAGPHPADRMSLEGEPRDFAGDLGRSMKGLRIAWCPSFGRAPDPIVLQTTRAAALAFSELGAEVEETEAEFGDSTDLYRVILQIGAAASIDGFLATHRDDLDPGLVNFAEGARRLSAIDFAKAQVARNAFYDRVRRFFERFDLLLTPTVPILPLKAGTSSDKPGSLGEDWIEWSPYTFPFNLTHLPAASVPAGWSPEGLPIGLQIVGRRF